MTFAQLNLSSPIFKAINACGYKQPTPIQARSIPDILNGRDVVACSETGSGKTGAFILPALHRLSAERKNPKPRILILTPTRELAAQITQAATKYGKFLTFNIVSLVGGMPYRQQLKGLSRPVDMIVATPGRLMDHMENHRLDLSSVEMLILDEADRMLDMGFIDDVRNIAKCTPKTRQTLLFSATVDNKLANVIRDLLKDPIRIDLSTKNLAPTQIKQESYLVDNLQHKNRLLAHFLENGNIFKAIIFSATKINADNLAKQLRHEGHAVGVLHGDLKQNVRNRTVEELRRGKIQFLIATDIAARGIDINDVSHVINYDLPKFSEDYVHRIGRTGRAGKSGIAISFVSPTDVRHLQRIERFVGHKMPLVTIPGLEPTKNMNANNPNPAKKKPFKHKHHGKGQGPRSDARGRGESRGYAPRGRSEGRSDAAPRTARSEGRSYAPRAARSENRGYAPHGHSDGRSDTAPRAARSESRGYAPRGRSEGRGDTAPRAARSENRGYAPRGRSESRSDAAPRTARSESRGYVSRERSEGRSGAPSHGKPRRDLRNAGDARRENSRPKRKNY